MTIGRLFKGKWVELTLLDLDQDAEIISVWTHDPNFLYLTENKAQMPLAAPQVKKNFSNDAAEDQPSFQFAIRLQEDGRLVGLARLKWIEWSHGSTWLELSIGSPQDRGHGYGEDALTLLLGNAFMELNLFRCSAAVFEYNLTGQQLLSSAGFQPEVRIREGVYRNGRWWDNIFYGILSEEWKAQNPISEAAR